jgi:hypothetical protein
MPRKYFYIVMGEDASLIVEERSIPSSHVMTDDVFGPYHTYQDACEAAANAEFELYEILWKLGCV